MDIQAQIPMALCVIHNFIHKHDSDKNEEVLPETQSFINGDDSDSQCPTMAMVEERNTEAGIRCDWIVQDMWDNYLHVLYDQGIDIVNPLDDDDFNDFYDNNS